jgi:hypothetical protein
MTLRITHIYRCIDGNGKLVHRQADLTLRIRGKPPPLGDQQAHSPVTPGHPLC